MTLVLGSRLWLPAVHTIPNLLFSCYFHKMEGGSSGVVFCCLLLRQGLTMYFKLTWNSQCSCLSLQNALIMACSTTPSYQLCSLNTFLTLFVLTPHYPAVWWSSVCSFECVFWSKGPVLFTQSLISCAGKNPWLVMNTPSCWFTDLPPVSYVGMNQSFAAWSPLSRW